MAYSSGMKILFPGRHHLFTRFQFDYLESIVRAGEEGGLPELPDVDGRAIGMEGKLDLLVIAITSADRSNTRRNPFELHYRFAMAEAFGAALGIPFLVFGLPDAGEIGDFAGWTLKRVAHESEGSLAPEPSQWAILCSTPVLEGYEALGFKILPAELADRAVPRYRATLPWRVVEALADSRENAEGPRVEENEALALVHPGSLAIWRRYGLAKKAALLFSDWMVGDEGDLTESRDYNSYVREMDEIAAIKFAEVEAFVKPGRVGDIGCAAGSWIKLACASPRLRESDFYGIEVARKLFDLCLQRASNGDYGSPYVFFSKRNAVTGRVFPPSSMDTIHSSSLTHEILSYGSMEDLLSFIAKRIEELAPGGVWINRDPIGPPDGDRSVFLELRANDGREGDEEAYRAAAGIGEPAARRRAITSYLDGLSTFGRFLRFARDFRQAEGEAFDYRSAEVAGLPGWRIVACRLRDAMEFLLKKDYTDNWESECRERFCFWSFEEWREALLSAGYAISPLSRAYRNEWIAEHRIAGKARLLESRDGAYRELPLPETHMVMIAGRPQ